MEAEEILGYADLAVRYGGKQAADVMATDLREYLLQDGAHPELLTTSQCLAAEAAILMGDASMASAITANGSWPDLGRSADARLAIAAAHGRRISADTSAAGRLYDAVWRHHAGPARHTAGLWVADIHMWQGRFATAFALCGEILNSCDPGEQELQGDVLRLMHLGHRFHLDVDDAATTLDQARDCYQRSGAVVGLANVATNHVELLAWTEPTALSPPRRPRWRPNSWPLAHPAAFGVRALRHSPQEHDHQRRTELFPGLETRPVGRPRLRPRRPFPQAGLHPGRR
ncbi:MAG: hypothetical protein WAK86_03190 [Pseudonocardiaceae bacterium]